MPEDSIPKPTFDWETFHERNGITTQSGLPLNLEVVKLRAENRKAQAKSPIAILIKEIRELEGKFF